MPLTKLHTLRQRLKNAINALRGKSCAPIMPVNVAQINYGELLHGKTVLVTGGSSGIGLAIAEKCLAEGATVIITGRNEAKLLAVIEKLQNKHLHAIQWDVSDIHIIDSKLDEALTSVGDRLDILVNNAGHLGGNSKFLDLTEQRWDDIMSVNSKGLVFLTQSICRRWIDRKQGGKVINISSMRGFLGVVDGPYGMSKWALVGLTAGLAAEFLRYGIIINGIAPGITDTDSISIKGINARKNAHLDIRSAPDGYRIGLREEMAELAAFLMSDASNYIIGQTILCDGGYCLKV